MKCALVSLVNMSGQCTVAVFRSRISGSGGALPAHVNEKRMLGRCQAQCVESSFDLCSSGQAVEVGRNEKEKKKKKKKGGEG